MAKLKTVVCLLALLAGASGCGYRRGTLITADVKTIHVVMFDNTTFWDRAEKVDDSPRNAFGAPRPGQLMNVALTQAVRNEITRRTGLKPAPANRADSILTGCITRVKQDVLVRDPDDETMLARVKIKISFKWLDARDRAVLASARNLSRPTDYYATRSGAFSTAAQKSFAHIAEMIVDRMQERF